MLVLTRRPPIPAQQHGKQTLVRGGGGLAMAARVRFEVGGTTRYPGPDYPRDAVACDFRVADRDGRVWRTTSTFTAELFVTHLYDFGAIGGPAVFTARRAPETWVRALAESPLLEDGKRRMVTLKRVTLQFDVAANNVTGSFLTDLAVRVRRAGFWDPEGSPLPELGFHLSCRHLLRANTAVPDPA